MNDCSGEMSFTMDEATMTKLRELMDDIDVTKTRKFTLSDRHGNTATYVRQDAQPKYEEISARDAAAKIAPTSLFTAYFWYSAFVELKRMGFEICRKMI